jgi:LemA protein
MVNKLDELSGLTNPEGHDVNVIDEQIRARVGLGTKVFEMGIWVVGPLTALGVAIASGSNPAVVALITLLGLIPGLVFQLMKTNALAYLRKLEQKVQADASQIDNYLEQRVQILQNLADLLSKSIELDKDVMKSVAAYRSGLSDAGNQDRNQKSSQLNAAFSRINLAFEAYPQLRAQENISEAMRQNAYLQKEITAARTLYNDTVATWNQDIFSWPTKLIIAAKNHFMTRIPFTASEETKAAARGRFFNA